MGNYLAMGNTVMVVLGLVVMVVVGPLATFGGTPLRVVERVLMKTNEPKNPGEPLNEKDFWLARQLSIKQTNFTSERMMKPVSYKRALENENQMEELEAKGAKHEKLKETKLGLSKLKYHWPNGEVPYVISADFSSEERAIIAQGITHIHDNSCVRFIARDGEEDYVDIITGSGGCYAIIPYYTGRGRCEVGLEQGGCVTMKIVVHELLHALGIKHEQSRPDRDDHITMVWSNIVASGGGQFFKDVWEGTDPSTLPAECDDTDAADGKDYSNCVSGWEVDACGFGYDYTSVMHYRLNSFAIDSSQNVMIPIDTSVTAAGNTELSDLDKKKLQCMYNCDGTTYSGCGGHVSGDSGTLDALDDSKCNWFITVPDGYAIEISFEVFDVDCADKLKIYDGKDETAAVLGEYCNDNAPTLITSSDSKLYISWARTVSANKFKASWKKFKIECCAKIKLESTGGAASDLGSWMTEFTYTAGDDINDRPIYKAGNLWIAVKTVSEGFVPSWIVSSTDFGVDPGSGSGMIFGGSGAPKCPTAVSSWRYFNQVETVVDETLKAVCAVDCTDDPPAPPAGASSDDGGGATAAGTVVTYDCGNDDKKYAKCGTDGKWSPATIPDCGSTTAAPAPVTTAPAPVTQAPTSCKPKYYKNKMFTGKLKKKVKRVKNVKICWKKCLSLGSDCVAVRWMKKKKMCYLLSAKGKLKKKKGFFAGACK